MKTEVTLRREGDDLAMTISSEIAELLDVSEGDKLYVVRTESGYALAPTNAERSDSPILRAFAEIREQYDDTFRRLAQ